MLSAKLLNYRNPPQQSQGITPKFGVFVIINTPFVTVVLKLGKVAYAATPGF